MLSGICTCSPELSASGLYVQYLNDEIIFLYILRKQHLEMCKVPSSVQILSLNMQKA